MIFHLYVFAIAASLTLCNGFVPNFFDAREKWPQCIGPIYDQAACNSSWAHAITSMMNDRYCIKSSSRSIELSPQDLLCHMDSRCGGAFKVEEAFKKVEEVGVLTRKCWPYTADGMNCANETCLDPQEKFERHKCSIMQDHKNMTEVKIGIIERGPMICVFRETIDHKDYYDGVHYKAHTKPRYSFQTAVKLIGWGIENGMGYWIAEQSLGEGFGENGYVRYKAADDFCTVVYECDPQ